MQRSVDEIPIRYRHIFEKFTLFNRMQSEIIDKILKTDKSIVVSAPTGSGKTVILELAIVRLLKNIEDTQSKDEFKIIYIAPIKALCNEITADWKSKFDKLGVLVGSVTGDDADFDLNTSTLSIIVTTPEKFDSLSRKWNAYDYMRAIKLLMIDEVHLLNEDKRGPILEAVVSRMKTIKMKLNQTDDSQDRIRFVAVSATIPNITDLASWLDDKDNTIYHKVSEDMRPVKLERHVIGYPYYNTTPFKFDMNLTYKLPSILEKYSNNKPALIFCNSRRSVEMGASTIIDKVRFNLSDEQRQKLSALSNQIEDTKLRNTVLSGVAFHHAGLCVSDKKLIEEYFRSATIPLLFSTNTLAMGVNLPAYLSVIKSTQMLVSGAVVELSEASILQMIGRAGRPQFDDHGVAVIMTQSDKVKKYENLITGTAPIESHLHNHLTEHLNSEIVSQTISNMELVTHWIRSSYLYIRAIQKPMHYGFPANAAIETVEQKLEELCVTAIDELEKYGLVIKCDSTLKATQLGRLMAHFYLNFETMKHLKKITGTENVQGIFEILITCPDFSSGFNLRTNDKRFLNELNKNSTENDCIRFPIQGKVKTVTDKVSCLMQAILGNIQVNDSSITEEASQLVKLGQRIGRALQEYIALLDVKNNFSALVSIMLLLKSLHANLWENSPYVFKQFNKIGHVYSKVLASNGKTTFESILNSTPSDIEMILKKRPPFGKDFLDAVQILPQFTIDVKVDREGKQICLVVKQSNTKFVCDSSSRGVTLIVGDSTNETLFIDHRVQYFLIKYGKFERSIALKNPTASTITAHLIHNGIVGLDKTVTASLTGEEQPEPMEEPPEPPIQVTAPKRKAQDKKGPPAKQPKISEFLTAPKKAPKRKNNSDTNAKKARTSQGECERQMEILENDGIGTDIVDLSEEDSTNGRSEHDQPNEDHRMTNQSAMEFVRGFELPKKSVFKFVRPTKPLNDRLDVNSEDSVKDTADESEAISHPIEIMLQPTVVPNIPILNNGQSNSFVKTTVNESRAVPHLNYSDRSVNIRKDSNGDKKNGETRATEEDTTEDVNDTADESATLHPIETISQPTVVPNIQPLNEGQSKSFVKTVINETRAAAKKNESNRPMTIRKDTNEDKTAFNESRAATNSNESNRSMNIRKGPGAKGDETSGESIATKKETKEDNRNVYVPSCIKSMFGSQAAAQKPRNPAENVPNRRRDINFRYDHLLTPIDQDVTETTADSQSYSLCNVIEGQHKEFRTPASRQSPGFAFHNNYINNFCAAKELQTIEHLSQMPNDANDNDWSLFSLEYDTVPSQRSSFQLLCEPIRPDRPSKPIDKATPMALNEHKYTKRSNFYKKPQKLQPSATLQSTNNDQPLNDQFLRSQNHPQKPETEPQFYNYLQGVPPISGGNVDSSKRPVLADPSIYSNNWKNSNDWFDSSQRSQQAATPKFSQCGYNSASLAPTFSQFGYNSASLAPTFSQFGYNSASIAPTFSQFGYNSASLAPTFSQFCYNSASLAPAYSQFGYNSASLAPTFSQYGYSSLREGLAPSSGSQFSYSSMSPREGFVPSEESKFHW